MSKTRLLTILAGSLLTTIAFASSAHASVYCVGDPSCPAGGLPRDTLNAAITSANAAADHDTIRVGPGTFSQPPGLSQPADIVGAGIGSTIINGAGGPNSVLYVPKPGSSVSGLSVHLTANQQVGIRLAGGADVDHVEVTAPHNLTAEDGVLAETAGSTIRSVRVDLGDDLSTCGINDVDSSTITDADVTAGEGICTGNTGSVVRRVTVRARTPIELYGGKADLADALLLQHPDDPAYAAFVGIDVETSSAGDDAQAMVDGVTIDGGGHGTGIAAWANPAASAGTASATVSGAVLRGLAHDIVRTGKSPIATADVAIDHSDFDATSIQQSAGSGFFSAGIGNLTTGVDPRFVDRAAGDYRLRFDSPLLDNGSAAAVTDNDSDAAGRARLRDSDGDGSAQRDMGAFEYQRLAPVPEFSGAVSGQSVGFDASKTIDPDGDPVSLGWAFGDGATGSGTSPSHLFAASGSYQTTLTATDATGLTASVSHQVDIALPGGGAGAGALPVISGLSQSARKWRERGGAPRISRRVPVGTTFGFRLDQAAKVRFAFKRAHHAARRAKTWTLSFAAHTGANSVRFKGRLSRRLKLGPGRYTLTVTATNAAGRRSQPRKLSFTILRG
jgi:PKD domain-containing protein